MKDEVAIVSLEPVERAGWKFKISSNDYEDGILVIATHDLFGYSTVKYFLGVKATREWIHYLVYSTKEILREVMRKHDIE